VAALSAFYGGVPYAYPIPNTAAPVYGVDQVPSAQAQAIISKYLQGQDNLLAGMCYLLLPSSRLLPFLFSFLSDNVTVFIPGDPHNFPFAG